MEVLMRRALALIPFLALAGCFSPDEPLCVFSCAQAPHECPSGYECRSDQYCHKVGTSGLCPGFSQADASIDAPMPDASMPDAAIDGPPIDAPIDAPDIDAPDIDADIDAP
jgi:hypothetical protein